MRELRQTWGLNVKAIRKAQGLTQSALAEKIGVTRAAVSFWESGDRLPLDRQKLAIAKALGVPVATLFPLVNVEVGAR